MNENAIFTLWCIAMIIFMFVEVSFDSLINTITK